jgi:hypothetical protein
MAEELDLLIKKVEILRTGVHNFQRANILVSSLQSAVDEQRVSWEQLGISKGEIYALLAKLLKAEFLPLWDAYHAGQAKLEDLADYFPYLKQAVSTGNFSFKDLGRFTCNDFFQLQTDLAHLAEKKPD